MTHERAKGWKIRRTLEHHDVEGVKCAETYEWLRFNDQPPYTVDLIGEWVEDPMDATIFTRPNLAFACRDEYRDRNTDPRVIYHAVVEV